MLTLIVFAIILGLLIFVHELGHFFVARRNGIKAEEFGFGFPPRIFGFVKDEKTGKYKMVPGSRGIQSENTIFSINWIPLGGFVKIKGESGEAKDEPDSFAGKSAWTRIKVLAAGVIMNFILAWIVFSIIFMIGAPQMVEEDTKGSVVQIGMVATGSPAATIGIREGDNILEICGVNNPKSCVAVVKVTQFQEIINSKKGEEISIKIQRGKNILSLKGTPRINPPEGQGPLGVAPVQVAVVSFPWYKAVIKGGENIVDFFILITTVVKNLILGKAAGVEISGPVKIFQYTGQVTELGFTYVLQLLAILSVNLGIINILPIPALDGGRILFILIEKIKGSPVNHRVENMIHTIGFVLLIALIFFITAREVSGLNILSKLKGIF